MTLLHILSEVMASADRDAFTALVQKYENQGFRRETAQRRAYLELVKPSIIGNCGANVIY
jgi:hypothetical protein